MQFFERIFWLQKRKEGRWDQSLQEGVFEDGNLDDGDYVHVPLFSGG